MFARGINPIEVGEIAWIAIDDSGYLEIVAFAVGEAFNLMLEIVVQNLEFRLPVDAEQIAVGIVKFAPLGPTSG